MKRQVATARQLAADSASSVLAQLEGILPDRVVVFGSLPPDGRDLDLLVLRRQERTAVAQWLAQHDFEERGDRWVRFGDVAVTAVELVPAETWHLPLREASALFAEGKPLAGMRKIVQPSPAHTILILARRRVWRGCSIAGKHRVRIDAAVAEDPDAWLHAEERAATWRLRGSLACLRLAYTRAGRADIFTRTRALSEAFARVGGGSVLAGVHVHVRKALRLERGALVALSGLDGAGKSSHAARLAGTLGVLGQDAVVVWSPLGGNPSVARFGGWGKRALGRLPNSRSASDDTSSARAASAGAAHRSSVPLGPAGMVSAAWVSFLGLTNVIAHARTVVHLARGRIVICDRYSLDSAVHLLHRYGNTRAVRLQIALISLLSPRPRRAYLLEVAPEVALRRKADRWTTNQLRRRFELYRELHEAFGARRLNADQPEAQLAIEIAKDVWASLA